MSFQYNGKHYKQLHGTAMRSPVSVVVAEIVMQNIGEQASGKRGEFHISHDASRLISVFSPRWKERSRVSREIFKDLNFKMQLIQGRFQ